MTDTPIDEPPRYMVPGGHGIEAHAAGLLYRRVDVLPILAENAALRAEVERARRGADRATALAGFSAGYSAGCTPGYDREQAIAAFCAALAAPAPHQTGETARVRFVTIRRYDVRPSIIWRAYSPERPDLGSTFAGSEHEALEKIRQKYANTPDQSQET